MVLTDSHCHLDFAAFDDDRDEVIGRAKAVGVTKMVIPSVSHRSLDRLHQLCQSHSELFYGVGIHPLFAEPQFEDALGTLAQFLESKPDKCVAIGECGIDMVSSPLSLEQQMTLFEGHCRLAQQHQLPLLIHSRKAHHHLLPLLDKYPLPAKGVIHGFSGSAQMAKEFVKRGFYLGVGGVVTYERAQKTRQAIAEVDRNFLLLETDSPDMPVSGFQGMRNEPCRIQLVLQAVTELLDLPCSEVSSLFSENSYRFFNRLV